MTKFLKDISRQSTIVMRAEFGPVFTPRFFCCDDPNALGISAGKTPVCSGVLSPSPARVGETVNFDASGSYDPDGTITNWSWSFAGGTPPTSTAQSGTVTWATPGRKKVRLVVRDGTGLASTPCEQEIIIADPAGAFFMATSTGPWSTIDGGQNWTSIAGNLPAAALDSRAIAQDPRGPLWLATAAGVFASIDGGVTWYDHTPAPPGSGDRAGQIFHIAHLGVSELFIASYLGTDQSFIYLTEEWRNVRTDPATPLTWGDFWEDP